MSILKSSSHILIVFPWLISALLPGQCLKFPFARALNKYPLIQLGSAADTIFPKRPHEDVPPSHALVTIRPTLLPLQGGVTASSL